MTSDTSKLYSWDLGTNESVPFASAFPKARYKLKLAPGLYFNAVHKPNAWVRFWQRILLGWTWGEIED